MKSLPLAILTSSMLAGCAYLSPPPMSQSEAEAQLKALDDAWIAAEVAHDRATLERVLHEDFIVTYASGKTLERAAFIDEIMSGDLLPFKVVHDRIRVTGDTAVVIDEAPDHTVKYTWIAIRQDKTWRIISETMTRVTPPK